MFAVKCCDNGLNGVTLGQSSIVCMKHRKAENNLSYKKCKEEGKLLDRTVKNEYMHTIEYDHRWQIVLDDNEDH